MMAIPNDEDGEIPEIKLRQRQIEWANRAYNILSNNYGYIDTSRMGSGKTFVLIWLAKIIGFRLIIVCPVIMRNIWRTITNTYGIPTIGIISYSSLRSKRGHQPPHGYLHRFDNLTEFERQQGWKKSVTFAPTQEYLRLVDEGILLVFDEMQYIKNTSAQYKAAMLHPIVTRGGRSRFAFLSATPFDEEKHSINLLRLIGYIRSRRLYHYDKYTRTTVLEGILELIDACYAINPKETQLILNEIPQDRGNMDKLAYTLYVRVIKPNISGSMPPPDIRGVFDIKNGFFDIDLNYQSKLRAGIVELARALRMFAAANAVEMNLPHTDEIEEINILEPANIGAVTTALVKIENAKAFDMARVATKILTNVTNSKVIISINYTTTLEILSRLLGLYNPLFLHGKVNPDQRTQVINLFNTNPNYRLLIMNTAVGGVGVSLHDTVGNAPRYMLISPSYKLLEIIQAAGRIYRDGTMSDAYVRVFYGKGNIGAEMSILLALARKTVVLKGVIDEHLNDLLLLPGEYPAEQES